VKSGNIHAVGLCRVQAGGAVAGLWFGPFSVAAAWLGLGLALVLSPDRFGDSICWVQDATGLPCLGCGLTRSLSCALRGMFSASWHYHPFGIFILPLFLIIAGQSLLPRNGRQQCADFLESHARVSRHCYFAVVLLFVAYGVGRALWHGLAS
jgi:hypothetical protein